MSTEEFVTNLLLKSGKKLLLLLLILLVPLFVYFSIFTIKPGYSALQLRMGSVVRENRIPGWYFKIPLIDKIVKINSRICKIFIKTTTLSHDLQTVSMGVAVNYRILNPLKLYSRVGRQFESVIIDPFAQESIKAITAKFTAENLIQHRHEVKERVVEELAKRLSPLDIELIDFNFVHSDFSEDFIKAVESKQIAEQMAKMSKNLTAKVEEEAKQARLRAEAQAYALKVKKESVTPELINLKKAEAFIKAVDKWNGQLPKVLGGNIPLLKL